jgi:hypothetical protein
MSVPSSRSLRALCLFHCFRRQSRPLHRRMPATSCRVSSVVERPLFPPCRSARDQQPFVTFVVRDLDKENLVLGEIVVENVFLALVIDGLGLLARLRIVRILVDPCDPVAERQPQLVLAANSKRLGLQNTLSFGFSLASQKCGVVVSIKRLTRANPLMGLGRWHLVLRCHRWWRRLGKSAASARR